MDNFIFEKIKRIQALAETGLEFNENSYDRERYTELHEISLQILSQLTNIQVEKIAAVISDKNGYKTPKVDVRAVVFNEKNQILLIQEKADNCWAMPGGWADVGYSPAEVAVKECFEEAGLKVETVKLLAVLDKQKQKMPPAFEYVYKIFLLCRKLNDNISVGTETIDVGWFDENNLPPLSTPRNTIDQIKMMFQFHRGEKSEPEFD
jgi:ADP-ribose pyrophosphatase YjhB (NUDIX family)